MSYSDNSNRVDTIGAKIVGERVEAFKIWRENGSQRDSISRLAIMKYDERNSKASTAFWRGFGAYVAGSIMVFGATYGSCSERNHSDYCLPPYLAYPIG